MTLMWKEIAYLKSTATQLKLEDMLVFHLDNHLKHIKTDFAINNVGCHQDSEITFLKPSKIFGLFLEAEPVA